MFSWQDYIVVGIYFVFIIAVGVVYRKASKDSSDFFAGGGSMTWWMTGATVFMANFSAWTFVACAGRIYQTGTLIIFTVFTLQGIFGLIMAVKIVLWYRRMRVITPVEAIQRRFGRATEQIYGWQMVISQFLFAGIGLYTLAVFIAPLLGISINLCMVIVGSAIVFMSVTGGAWAVVASDFVQMLVLVIIILITVTLLLIHPDVGGIVGFVDKLPEYQFDWTKHDRMPVLMLFLFSSALRMTIGMFNMSTGAGRFIYVRSDKDARRACIMFSIGFLIGPVIWFIPPMAASFLFPNIAEMFPALKNPQEAAYIAVAAMVLPKGMLGMLACGIFAASMSSMDSGLNRNSGILVLNIYKPLFRPDASEKEYLLVGKVFTLVVGAAMVFGGILFARIAKFNLYEWSQHMNAMLWTPLAIPLFMGLIFKKTPKWTAWTSIILIWSICYIFKFCINYEVLTGFLGWEKLTRNEMSDVVVSVVALAGFTFGFLYYWICARLYKRFPLKEKDLKRTDAFFKDIETPVLADSDEHKHTDSMQYRNLGAICLAYGGVLFLGFILPNNLSGRFCFMICGLFIGGIGAILYWNYLKIKKQQAKGLKCENY